ncbi:unnamed protein product [Meganyctiphanes norvegica]|uniref:A-kinase anchor protein 2 C-terminal domain-containing protein n=1 Tax=Meganyctiphanes norvegica TaxID=48144 RepID=A0AAV2PZF6_MEGNR
MTEFKGELDSAVSKYLTQVKEITSPNTQRDLPKVQFKFDPEEIKSTNTSFDDPESELNFGDDYEDLQINIAPLVDPLHCTDCPGEHFEEPYYENCIESGYDEHIYENVENSTENEENHHYDILSNVPKPSLPPKPDFLSQLAAQQSAPVKKIWNPFVNSAIDADEFPETNPFNSTRMVETNEQTMIIDGLDTSDLGSSGEDTISVEEWPLPPTPPAEDVKCILEDVPLPPPPPEMALQQLEEVIRKEEERRMSVHLQKEAIEQKYGLKAKTEEPDAEAVNTNISSLDSMQEEEMENTFIAPPKLIELQEESSTDDDAPAIRHSLIIDLQDSCLVIPHTPKPSESVKSNVFNFTDHNSNVNEDNEEEKNQQIIYQNVKNNFRECIDFPVSNDKFPNTYSPEINENDFISLPARIDKLAITGQEIPDIPEESEELNNDISLQDEYDSINDISHTNIETIAAPPSEFQTDEGSDGIYTAALIDLHSGPSSLANTSSSNISVGNLEIEENINSLHEEITTKQAISSKESIVSFGYLNPPRSSSKVFGPKIELKKIHNTHDKDHWFDKPKESLPKPGLLTFVEPSLGVEQKRKSVIKEITVKAKRKDTWIKINDLHDNSSSGPKSLPLKKSQSFSFDTRNPIQKKNPWKNITTKDDLSAKNNNLEGTSNSLGKKTELLSKNDVANEKFYSLPKQDKPVSEWSSRDFNGTSHSFNNGSLAALGINKHTFKTANLASLKMKKHEKNSWVVQDNVNIKSSNSNTKDCDFLETKKDIIRDENFIEYEEKTFSTNAEESDSLLSEILPKSTGQDVNHSYVQNSIQFLWSDKSSKCEKDQMYSVNAFKNESNDISSDMNSISSIVTDCELNEDNKKHNTKEIAFKSDFIEIGELLTEEADDHEKNSCANPENTEISHNINQREEDQYEDSLCSQYSEETTFEKALHKESQDAHPQKIASYYEPETFSKTTFQKQNKENNFRSSDLFELAKIGTSSKEDFNQRFDQSQSLQEGFSDSRGFSEWSTIESVLSKDAPETSSQNVELKPVDETCNQTINKKINKEDQSGSSKYSECNKLEIISVEDDSSQNINQIPSIQESCISSSKISSQSETRTTSTKEAPSLPKKRSVVYESILENRKSTSAYWERRMVEAKAMEDDGGWESVANVEFQPHHVVEESPENVNPGLDFLPAPPPQFDNSLSDDCENVEPTSGPVDDDSLQEPTFLIDPPPPMEETPPQQEPDNLMNTNIKQENKVPAKQYVYGVNEQSAEDLQRGIWTDDLDHFTSTRAAFTCNKTGSARIVETMIKKSASQENIIEAEIRAQQHKEEQLRMEGTLKGVRERESSSPASHESDEGFVDRVAPEDASNQFTNSTNLITTNGYTHTIAGTDGEPVIYDAVPPPAYNAQGSLLGLSKSTETKIALEIRELKEREEELKMIRERLNESRQGFNEEDDTQSNSSRDQLLDDHLTSLTATTDEGNYSECGDPVFPEDKSSTSSNSGMSTPDLMSRGNLFEGSSRRRTMTVMPFQEDAAEDEQPVYHRMQKESVIEREIRLAGEREDAFRAEKGLLSSSTETKSPSVRSTVSAPQDPVNDARDLTHRMATSRIQQEIQEVSIKEKELRDAGTILTTSEESVDSKVTRLSDLAELNWGNDSPLRSPSQSSSGGRRGSSAFSPTSSPVPNFTPSPVVYRNNLKKSLSTTNLATSPISTSNVRAPKGLMQKFIASRGKMTTSAFSSTSTNGNIPTDRGIPTRPMRVEPKVAVIRREQNQRLNNQTTEQQKTLYRRSYCTAGEKIQSELKEMQRREEELRILRAASLATSQPNLADLGLDDGPSESSVERESNGLQSAVSNPNLLDDESSQQPQVIEKGVRRRSALIAQWENRIQQTIDT